MMMLLLCLRQRSVLEGVREAEEEMQPPFGQRIAEGRMDSDSLQANLQPQVSEAVVGPVVPDRVEVLGIGVEVVLGHPV